MAASARAKPGNWATGAKYVSARSRVASKLTRAATASTPSARGGRHAETRHLRGSETHRELHEAGAVETEGHLTRNGRLPGEVVRGRARRADDQDFRGGGDVLEEGAGDAEAGGGRGGGEGFQHDSDSSLMRKRAGGARGICPGV